MRLKSIKLAGFKSFVDPTLAAFPKKMTAIVGPNGCGKSNIIDAVRWVMGESSAKSLRGESMTDVIFKGSSVRKPVSQASIELLFDNSDAKVAGEYASYNEISVKRRVNRDSQSQYFLNGTRCRRRDITDIFLGTGLGARSYSIIEQGMIARLIEARPEEMRLFIEEAAGISKYKDRRRETENRMRRTHENLERLTDIRDELGRQLERLARQASAAERYKELKAEERQKSAELLALRWRDLDAQTTQLDTRLRDLEVAREQQLAGQRHAEAQLEEGRELSVGVQEKFNSAQQQYYALGAEIARLEQSRRHQQELRTQLDTSLEQTRGDIAALDEVEDQDRYELEEQASRLAVIAPEVELLREQQETAAETLATADEAMQQWLQDWETFNHHAASAQREADVEQSQSRHLEASIERLSDRVKRLQDESDGLDTNPLAQEMARIEEDVDTCQERLLEAETTTETLQTRLQELRAGNQQRRGEMEAARTEVGKLEARQISLQALQKAAMGDDGRLAGWLTSHQLDTAPKLADQLVVEPGWEAAVEAVLGDALQGVCIEGFDAVSEWLADFEQGSLHLLAPLSGSAVKPGRLAARLSGGVIPACLDSVHCVDELVDALAMRPQLGGGESVVTRAGIWLGRDWLRWLRHDEQGGVLARRQELEVLADQIEVAQENWQVLSEQLDAGREQAAHVEQQREDSQQQMRRISYELSELNAQKSAREVRLEQVTMRHERLAGELAETRERLQVEEGELGDTRQRLAIALDAMAEDSEQRALMQETREQKRRHLDELQQQSRGQDTRLHQLAMEERTLETQRQALMQGLQRQSTQREGLQRKLQELEQQQLTLETPNDAMEQTLEDCLAERLEAEALMGALRLELDDAQSEARRLEAARSQYEQRQQQLREELEAERLAGQETRVRGQTLAEQLQEARYDLPTLLQLLPDTAREADWQAALAELARRIGRLGQINLAAIDEYQQEKQRKEYLDRQNDDLEEALATLEGAIRRIDKETRSRFKEYFERINAGFQALFPKVFGGGNAYLELTSDDLLDAGVAIMARPPGKQNSTIHLLSGGEKSMVALSLIFSIFKLNPAPFCILDEVDAPLDDANVGRFCNLVHEMSPLVQFIYITHNKIAMEMADSLMGVTMHEPGVSRLVAVDVEQAAEMASA